MHLYHCHATPLKKHIHKGLYGAFIIDPKEPRTPARELVMVMNGYDTDGDGAQQLLHGQRAQLLLREVSDQRQALGARPHLPREPDGVRPHQLVPPARRLLPLPADRHRRELGVHRHGRAVPGPARRPRDRVREHGSLHVPRAPVGVRGARLDGLLRRRRLMDRARRTGRRSARAGGSGRSGRCCCSSRSSPPSPPSARRSPISWDATRRRRTCSTSAVSSSTRARSGSGSRTRSRTT